MRGQCVRHYLSSMPVTRFEDLDLTRQYTYADYLTWEFRERVELLRGWIARMSPAPSRYHQKVAGNLHLALGNHFQGGPCELYIAPFDVRLPRTGGGESVVQPDLCVICDEDKLTERGCTGAPDWVIEVLSPGNSKREMRDKFGLYEESGVREYWIVDPAHDAIQTYVLTEGGLRNGPVYYANDEEAFSPGLFPELRIKGEDVF